MKINKRYLKYGLITSMLIIIVPIFIDYLIIGNKFPSNIDNSDWVAFFGNYVGSLIGSITTLIGIIVTLDFTRKQAKSDREFTQQQMIEERNFLQGQANEDRRLSIAPYLKYTMYNKRVLDRKHDIDILHVIDENVNTYVNASISIKNIGMGPLIDFQVYNIKYKNELLNYTIDSKNDVLETNSELFILVDLRLRLDEIKNETLIKMPPGHLVEYSPPPECDKSGILSFNIGYKDLIGNKYEQDIKIIMSVGCECEVAQIMWKYLTPEIRLDSVEKSRIVN